MAHREGIRQYLKDVQVHGLVYDWGCGTKPIKNYLKQNDAKFVGIDKLSHVGADLVWDIESNTDEIDWLNFGNEGADFAFCLEVIEHVWDSEQLIRNIYKTLKKGGVIYLSQPFMYEVHKEDDRIRYTHYGLKQLLEEFGFAVQDIQPTVGDLDHAEGYILKAVK